MKDLNLIDIEQNIYEKLSSTCDMNQEAADYIKNSNKDIFSFGLEEEEKIILSGELALSKINSYPLNSAIPLIKKIIDIFSKTNLSHLKNGYFSSVFIFQSPVKQHSQNLKKTEEIYKELLVQKEDYFQTLSFFDEIQKGQIKILEETDKNILLGKCIFHQLSKIKDHPREELALLQKRIFQMEISKNIPLQIISKIQIGEEIIIGIMELLEKKLIPDFEQYLEKYINVIETLKKKEKILDLNLILPLYQNILRDIKNLEIIDEDLEEKFQDLKESLPLLLK